MWYENTINNYYGIVNNNWTARGTRYNSNIIPIPRDNSFNTSLTVSLRPVNQTQYNPRSQVKMSTNGYYYGWIR